MGSLPLTTLWLYVGMVLLCYQGVGNLCGKQEYKINYIGEHKCGRKIHGWLVVTLR